jgi:hypothetical protein
MFVKNSFHRAGTSISLNHDLAAASFSLYCLYFSQLPWHRVSPQNLGFVQL